MDSGHEIFEFEEKTSFSFAKAWRGFKNALMGTLFVMANDMDLSFGVCLIGMIIDFLQMIAFTFNGNTPFSFTMTNWLVQLCNIAQLQFYISLYNPLQNLIIYIIAVLIVFLNLYIIGIVYYRFIKKKAQNVYLLKILRSFTSLLTTIFFMPFLSIFLLITSCALNISINPPACPTDQANMLLVSSIIFSVIFSLVSFIVIASFYELDYRSDDVSAKSHARIDLMYFIVQAILTTIFSLWGLPQYYQIQCASVLISGCAMTFLYTMYMPYYDYRVSVIQSQFVAVYTWSGICGIIAYTINDINDSSTSLLFYVGSVPIWILTKETCDWRRRKLIEKSIYTVANSYQVELHTRFMIIEMAGGYKNVEEKILNEAEDFYYKAERKFPDSSLLKIFVAQFHLTYRDRREAIPKLEQAEMRSPALDEQFIIYKTRQCVGKDVITMVTFTSYLESSSKAEILALNYQLEFWKALTIESSGNDSKLASLSKNISKNIDTASNNYKFMLSVDRTHKKMVPMYVYFMEDVLHRKDGELKNLKNRLRDMEPGQGLKNVINTASEQHPRISLSVDKTNLGRIDKVNPEMTAWIKMPKAKLINQRVDSLMPYFFGQCFISYLSKIKENWEETLGIPPVELYFIDNDQLLLGCTCNFVLDSEENSKNQPDKRASENSINYDTKGTTGTFMSPSRSFFNLNPGKNFESWHKPVTCVLVPHEESESIIFISSDHLIMNYNLHAAAFFGMNNEVIGIKNIKDFITNFEGIFERAKKHIDLNSGMLVEFSPVQTFLISNSGTFSRIRILINSYCYDNNIYYILSITEPGSYSKPTQKFFSLFIKFLEVYLRKGQHLSAESLQLANGDDDMDESLAITKLLYKVRKQVEKKNKKKSPELVCLSNLLWVFMILMMAVFGSSYAVSVISFEDYLFQITQIDIITDIRVQSSLMNAYTIMLDMARQGYPVPDTVPNLFSQLNSLAQDTNKKVNYISDTSTLSELKKSTIPLISYKYLGGYEINYDNLVNALLKQTTYITKSIPNGLENFNTLNNSYIFWSYFNGNTGIRNSLDSVIPLFIAQADNSRQAIELWAYTFASIEIALIISVLLLSLPLILKSEELSLRIIRVFYTLPIPILQYLQEITRINLEMRKDKHYPDNRTRYQGADDLWEEFLTNNEKRRRNSLSVTMESNAYSVTFWTKFRAFYKNSFTRRLIIYCIISAGISWGLQTYVGVIMPTMELNNAATIIANSGLIEAYQAQATTSMLSEILSPLQEDSMSQENYINSFFNNSIYFFQYPTVESGFNDTLNNTYQLKTHFNMLMQGNIHLGVSFDQMHYLQLQQFIGDFVPDLCQDFVTNCSFYYGVVGKGFMYSVFASIFDTENVAYSVYYEKNLSVSERLSIPNMDLLNLLVLQYNYLNTTSYYVKHDIINYYTGLVNNYNFIQELVLIFYYIFCVSYMIFIFRRTLVYHERKKRMTRSMLLLIPHRVVEFSKQIQRALENMNYD